MAKCVNPWEQGQLDVWTPVCMNTWESPLLCTEGCEQVSLMAKCCKYVTAEITNQDLTQQIDKQLLEGPKVQLLG